MLATTTYDEYLSNLDELWARKLRFEIRICTEVSLHMDPEFQPSDLLALLNIAREEIDRQLAGEPDSVERQRLLKLKLFVQGARNQILAKGYDKLASDSDASTLE